MRLKVKRPFLPDRKGRVERGMRGLVEDNNSSLFLSSLTLNPLVVNKEPSKLKEVIIL